MIFHSYVSLPGVCGNLPHILPKKWRRVGFLSDTCCGYIYRQRNQVFFYVKTLPISDNSLQQNSIVGWLVDIPIPNDQSLNYPSKVDLDELG